MTNAGKDIFIIYIIMGLKFMNSHEIRLSSTRTLIEEKKTIKGYITDWEDTLNEIEHELKEREKDYTCY